MSQPKCLRCTQTISTNDTVTFDVGRIVHLDCVRPRCLSYEERAILFRYCSGHAVAKCAACALVFRQQELAADLDLLGYRSNLCPRCRADLTESIRDHVYNCAMLPVEVRRGAQEARDAARKLVKQSDQLSDEGDLIRETEAAIAVLRETMLRASGG